MSDDADKAPVVAEPAAAPKPKSKGGAKGKKAAPADDVKYESGDIVLARLRGYPPWRECGWIA
jgi:hypothetical protein